MKTTPIGLTELLSRSKREKKDANQIIDELMRETRTKDHHHKNQLRDGWVLGGRATQPNDNNARLLLTKSFEAPFRICDGWCIPFLAQPMWDESKKYPIPLCWWNRMYKKFYIFLSLLLVVLASPTRSDVINSCTEIARALRNPLSLGPPSEKPILIFHHKFTSLTSPIHTVLRDFFSLHIHSLVAPRIL